MKKSASKPAPKAGSKASPKNIADKQKRLIAIGLRLQPDVLADVDDMARKAGVSRTGLIHVALARLLRNGI